MQKRNFVREMNAFFKWLNTNRISMRAQVLYMRLFDLYNSSHWTVDELTVDFGRIMGFLQTQSKHTVISARNELIENGLLEFTPGKRGAPSVYKLIFLSGIYDECEDESDEDDPDSKPEPDTDMFAFKPELEPDTYMSGKTDEDEMPGKQTPDLLDSDATNCFHVSCPLPLDMCMELRNKAEKKGIDDSIIISKMGAKYLNELTMQQYNEAMTWLDTVTSAEPEPPP